MKMLKQNITNYELSSRFSSRLDLVNTSLVNCIIDKKNIQTEIEKQRVKIQKRTQEIYGICFNFFLTYMELKSQEGREKERGKGRINI